MSEKKILKPVEAYQALINGEMIVRSNHFPIRLYLNKLQFLKDYDKWVDLFEVESFRYLINLKNYYIYKMPKPKRNIYKWEVQNVDGLWWSPSSMYDENGFDSVGDRFTNWESLQDKRKASEPIEVDAL